MRGTDTIQSNMFSYITPEQRVPKDHPLRRIRPLCDIALKALSEEFDRMYSDIGRPSIAPERLLRALMHTTAVIASAASRGTLYPLTRWSLRLLAGVGLLGSAFHAYGISRNMGGWRNWSQNLLNGPPLPAPPAFAALAIAGLVAVRLRQRSDA